MAIPGNGSGGVPIVEYNSPPTGDAMVYCGSFDGQGFTKVYGCPLHLLSALVALSRGTALK